MSDNPDGEVLNELFKTYREMMFKIAIGILHNDSDAEDAVQDAFLYIINNLEKISQIPCNKRACYFANIIEHKSIDIYRKKTNHPTEDIDEHFDLRSDENVEEEVLSTITVDEIKSVMNKLSDREYDMLYLYLFEEKSPKDIGETLGISESDIRTYVKRARNRLDDLLRKKGIDYDT